MATKPPSTKIAPAPQLKKATTATTAPAPKTVVAQLSQNQMKAALATPQKVATPAEIKALIARSVQEPKPKTPPTIEDLTKSDSLELPVATYGVPALLDMLDTYIDDLGPAADVLADRVALFMPTPSFVQSDAEAEATALYVDNMNDYTYVPYAKRLTEAQARLHGIMAQVMRVCGTVRNRYDDMISASTEEVKAGHAIRTNDLSPGVMLETVKLAQMVDRLAQVTSSMPQYLEWFMATPVEVGMYAVQHVVGSATQRNEPVNLSATGNPGMSVLVSQLNNLVSVLASIRYDLTTITKAIQA